MQARRCQGCAAPLPETAPGTSVRCPFCGLLHDAASATGGGPATVVVEGGGAPAARIGRWVAVVAILIVLAVAVPIVAGLVVAFRAARASHGFDTVVSSVTSTVSKAMTLDELRELPSGFHPIDVAPPAGGYAAVEAVAALPWALTIAQAWEPDARLERIDVTRLRPDGTVNVQDDGEAELQYRFRSPSRMAALVEQGRLRESAEAGWQFWVEVKQGQPRAYANRTRAGSVRGESVDPHPSVLPLTALMARPPVRKMRADVPFLNAYMIHSEGEGWVWYFSTLANESMPRVRARDGAVWPYPRR